jgi:hypothetical protein
MAEIDRLAVADLGKRYGIKKPSLYKRIKSLNLKSFKVGRKAYLTASQVELLDQLNKHLSAQGSTADFLDQRGLLKIEPNRTLEAATATPAINPDWRENLRFLEEAYQHRWLLSTSHLSELLEISNQILLKEKTYECYGFSFTQAGMNGAEVAWKITKS